MHEEELNEETSSRPNKEQLKRDTQALKAIVVQLIGLPASKLEGISLDEITCSAILAAKKMKRTALKRQIKYLTNLMRNENTEIIGRQLYLLAQPKKQQLDNFHKIEKWRDSLLSGDEGLINDLVDRFPSMDRQYIRQLVRNADKEKAQGRPPKAARTLYRFLMDLTDDD